MGQKINPTGLRVGVIYPFSSTWYAGKKDFGKYLKEDYDIREYIKRNYYDAAISDIKIERAADNVKIDVYCGRVGVAVGKKLHAARAQAGDNKQEAVTEPGTKEKGIDDINKAIRKIVGPSCNFNVNIHEIKNTDLDAQLVAENIALALEKRTPYRRALKGAMGRTLRAGAKGIKAMVSGRLDGNEIARSESYHEGSIPLQTIRADIDYGFAEAHTTYGVLGVKVWIYKGEIFGKGKKGGNN
ncbi:MAG TPA: 30S ribosomal protein S3 [Clostridia bacterium]|jgi:small subunit ribosomal protein S3|nr:30S ribosomal protein S3 [Clostridia bacterium]